MLIDTSRLLVSIPVVFPHNLALYPHWILMSVPPDEDEPSPRADDAESYVDMVPEVLQTWHAAKSLEEVVFNWNIIIESPFGSCPLSERVIQNGHFLLTPRRSSIRKGHFHLRFILNCHCRSLVKTWDSFAGHVVLKMIDAPFKMR